MRKMIQMILAVCVVIFAVGAMANNSNAATDGNVQATLDGKSIYFQNVQSTLFNELSEGVTYSKKVKTNDSKVWINLENAVIVKQTASKDIFFTNTKNADAYIKANKKAKKVSLNAIKNAAKKQYDKEAPSITLTVKNKNVTNKNVTVTVSVKDNGKVAMTKWTKGKKAAKEFTSKDSKVTKNAFTVSENGTYTVYAIDNKGVKRAKSITISTIDKVKPTLTLAPNTTETTSDAIVVTAKAKDNDKVAVIKFARDVQTASYFEKSGTVVKNNKFEVNSNGAYTVYVKDRVGNVYLQTIEISNIDNAAPTINIEVPTTDVTAVSKKIQIAVADINGVKDQKWAYGNQTVAYFAENGSRIAPLQNANQKDKIIALKNGVYTIYAEDNLGNKKVKTVTIDGIKDYTEVTEEGVHCEVCRMDLHKTDPQKIYSTKAIDDQGHTHYFCRIGCLLHQEQANGVEYAQKFVSEYSTTGTVNWIPLEDTITVKFKDGETAKGVMGWKLFHFKDITAAANYLGTTTDKVVVEKLENIKAYALTNNKGMTYEYEIDKAAK